MAEIVAFIAFATVVVLFISALYHHTQKTLQPKWAYGVAAICAVCQFVLAFLLYEQHPILALILFAGACALSYIICRMAMLRDRLERKRKRS